METNTRTLLKPMLVALVMYIVMAVLKFKIGYFLHSPLLIGDAYHMCADIAVNLFIMLGLWYSLKPESEQYPFGLRDLQHVLQIFIGFGLAYTAWEIFIESLTGLVHYFPKLSFVNQVVHLPRFTPIAVSGDHALATLAFLGGCIATAWVVGNYQIREGKKHKAPGLIADGQETKSDVWVVVGIAIAIVLEYVFNLPWLEYLLSFGIVYLLLHTAYEIGIKEGLASLAGLLRSIGSEHDEEIRRLTEELYPVAEVSELRTFKAGGIVRVNMKVQTLASEAGCIDLKHAIAARLLPYLNEVGFEQATFWIRFETPEQDRHRVAFAAHETETGTMVAALSLNEAEVVYICDVANGQFTRISRVTDLPTNLDMRIRMLKERKVEVLYAMQKSVTEKVALLKIRATLETSPNLILNDLLLM